MNIAYRCVSCGHTFSSEKVEYSCPQPHIEGKNTGETGFRKGVLLVECKVDSGSQPAASSIGAFADPLELLPYQVTLADRFPAGNTPMVAPLLLRERHSLPGLYCKNESANPSGSLKDRASLLVAEQATAQGQRTVVLASTGNAGSAMACAGAAAGIRVILFVPETAPKAKLVQSLLYGALVVPVKGTYDDAFALSIKYTDEYGGINRNTAYNPLTIEGKKTAAVEMYNQLGGHVPDVVYIPTGDGVILSGAYKGFSDLVTLGFAASMPVLVAVQAEGSNSIARSWHENRETVLTSADTIADSISVASPAAGELALRALSETGGRAVEVSDASISAAQQELADAAGLFVEPSSAAAWAGVLADRENIDPRSNVVVLLTGSGFKDIGAAEKLVEMPSSIIPDLEHAKSALADHYGVG